MFKINKFKSIFTKIRTSVKLISLGFIAALLIVGIVSFVYKPTYSVSINGEFVGYTANKSELQKRINEYQKGDGENNLAFIEIENMPKYEICMLKKDIITNDEEIFQKITESGVKYYHYYALLEDTEEKFYVESIDEAESIIQGLKDKSSDNQDKISYIEKYETELPEFTNMETAISSLYKEPAIVKAAVQVAKAKTYVSTSRSMSNDRTSLGISFIKPVSGKITSRFGSISSVRSGAHTGLDIGASYGTKVKAAASGVVTYAGNKGSLGTLIVIDHGNGIQTYYGHLSYMNVDVGDKVSQGAYIGKVGLTGNTTGAHLHFEIRVNNVARNPENYI